MRTRAIGVLGCLGALAMAAPLRGAAPIQPDIRPAPAFSATQLLAPPSQQCITNGGTLWNQRYSPLTGREVWMVQGERWEEGFAITAAPLYFDGMVIMGFNGGEMGTRGRIKAFDAKSGALRWNFYTVPAPGEFGHETWPQDSDAWMQGGANVWQTPAVDPELGLLYFSTANPGPDLNGSVREGDNLFANSIVAIEAKKLWEFMTDGGVNTTVTTFEHKGRQMVVVHAGGGAFADGQRGDGIWMFSLDGRIGPVPPAMAPGGGGAPATALPAPVKPLDLAAGEQIYKAACQACHGADGTGGHGGGSTLVVNPDVALLRTVTTTGRNNMPTFREIYDADQIRDVA